MNNDILFWYTGATVWCILSGIITLCTMVGFVVGVCKGYRSARSWVGLKIITRTVSEAERERIFKMVEPCGDYDAKVITKWLRTTFDNVDEHEKNP